MADPFTDVSVSNYNLNPPPDDGSESSANEITWAKHKEKLSDPLKTAIETLNTNIGGAVDKLMGGAGVNTVSTTSTLSASVQGQLVNVDTSGVTITTPDATTVDSPFVFALVNTSEDDITLDGNGSQTIDGSPTITIPTLGGVTLFTNGTNWFTTGQNFTKPYPPGHLSGLTLSNAADAANDITFAVGNCRDAADTGNLVLSSALTKQLDASWAAGTNAGGRSSAGLADGTWHCFVIGKTDGTTDCFFHTDVDPSAVLPDGYTLYRRVGSILRESSSIVAFTQRGDYFGRTTLKADLNESNYAITAQTRTLSVPIGIIVEAHIHVFLTSGSNNTVCLITALNQTDETPQTGIGQIAAVDDGGLNIIAAAEIRVMTNTSGQIRTRCSASGLSNNITIRTRGWIDTRGRDA